MTDDQLMSITKFEIIETNPIKFRIKLTFNSKFQPEKKIHVLYFILKDQM